VQVPVAQSIAFGGEAEPIADVGSRGLCCQPTLHFLAQSFIARPSEWFHEERETLGILWSQRTVLPTVEDIRWD
jgi:hypothetical protein